MTSTAEQLYRQFLKEAHNDPNIVGFFLGGSRGKGLITKHSDYDPVMIVKNSFEEKYRKKYDGHDGAGDVELEIFSLAEFKKHVPFDDSSRWEKYNYAHLKVEVDKLSGEIQKLVDQKGRVPDKDKERFINGSLDAYINRVYRSVKCLRDGNTEASRFEAAESMPPLLDAVFALHENRLRPYYKYLRWELETFPLDKLPWSANILIEKLLKILATADVKTQQEILIAIEQVFCKEGFGKVFDGWGEKLPWMQNYHT